jgi:hypothetical protein
MRIVLSVQAVYYLATGLWPLLSLTTCEAVTGPKTDDWLVQTVGVLAKVIGAALLVGVLRPVPTRETRSLAAFSAIGFVAVDTVFVVLSVISRVYRIDAAAQASFFLVLAIGGIFWRRDSTRIAGD